MWQTNADLKWTLKTIYFVWFCFCDSSKIQKCVMQHPAHEQCRLTQDLSWLPVSPRGPPHCVHVVLLMCSCGPPDVSVWSFSLCAMWSSSCFRVDLLIVSVWSPLIVSVWSSSLCLYMVLFIVSARSSSLCPLGPPHCFHEVLLIVCAWSSLCVRVVLLIVPAWSSSLCPLILFHE